jgi:hypothetical protein
LANRIAGQFHARAAVVRGVLIIACLENLEVGIRDQTSVPLGRYSRNLKRPDVSEEIGLDHGHGEMKGRSLSERTRDLVDETAPAEALDIVEVRLDRAPDHLDDEIGLVDVFQFHIIDDDGEVRWPACAARVDLCRQRLDEPA